MVYLDEPTIGLDVVVKENVRKAIQKINATYGTTVILTTHDLTDIEELCSRIIIIDAGKKIYDGNLSHIKEKFGYMSSVEFLTGSPVLPEKVEFIRSLDPEYLELEYGENRLQVKFNRNNTSTTEITRQLMGTLDVLEFSIKETSIEDIVKKIYRNEV